MDYKRVPGRETINRPMFLSLCKQATEAPYSPAVTFKTRVNKRLGKKMSVIRTMT